MDDDKPIVLPVTRHERKVLRQIRATLGESSLQNLLRTMIRHYAQWDGEYNVPAEDFAKREDPNAD